MKSSAASCAAVLAASVLMINPAAAGTTSPPPPAGTGSITLIHTGDIHGHLVPRPNVRSDSTGRMEGGLARVAAVIKDIRAKNPGTTLYVNTGDTLQGSAEAMFTRGQALIDVVNLFGVEAHAPGNWDYLYGTDRFLQTFVGTNGNPPLAPWHALAANLYYAPVNDPVTGLPTGTPYPDKAGQRVLPPCMLKTVGNINVGILGFTTRRGISVIGPKVTQGFVFTGGATELPFYIDVLRNTEKVDLVVLLSEIDLASTLQLVEAYPGVDFVLSADMHEKTLYPIVANSGTVLVEEGQDGTMLGEMKVDLVDHHRVGWTWTPHIITDEILPDLTVAAKIAAVRRPFVSGKGYVPNQTVTIGGNTATLLRPINGVVGYTAIPLHRSNFTNEDMPAAVEGSSHDFLTDAFRWAAGSDFAALRGFRYGTHIPAGPITLQDLYHFVPVAARIGKAYPVYGKQLKDQVENYARSVFDPNIEQWRGGWMFGYSGLTFDLDASQPYYNRASNIRVGGQLIDPLDTSVQPYAAAGYWFADDPNTINNCAACSGSGTIQPVMDELGNPLDATEIAVRYLATFPSKTVTTAIHRIKLLRPLPPPFYQNLELQPLKGAAL